ncbi:hypothetical protein MPSEU_000938600 [Mayamaea pseudoterrestris]|nr:hypothetical protein MPSEU_000938600 [Mayamaea pseudoterrestris]
MVAEEDSSSTMSEQGAIAAAASDILNDLQSLVDPLDEDDSDWSDSQVLNASTSKRRTRFPVTTFVRNKTSKNYAKSGSKSTLRQAWNHVKNKTVNIPSFLNGKDGGDEGTTTSLFDDPHQVAKVKRLVNFVYGKTSVQEEEDRVSKLFKAYEHKEALLIKVLETKVLLKVWDEDGTTSGSHIVPVVEEAGAQADRTVILCARKDRFEDMFDIKSKAAMHQEINWEVDDDDIDCVNQVDPGLVARLNELLKNVYETKSAAAQVDLASAILCACGRRKEKLLEVLRSKATLLMAMQECDSKAEQDGIGGTSTHLGRLSQEGSANGPILLSGPKRKKKKHALKKTFPTSTIRVDEKERHRKPKEFGNVDASHYACRHGLKHYDALDLFGTILSWVCLALCMPPMFASCDWLRQLPKELLFSCSLLMVLTFTRTSIGKLRSALRGLEERERDTVFPSGDEMMSLPLGLNPLDRVSQETEGLHQASKKKKMRFVDRFIPNLPRVKAAMGRDGRRLSITALDQSTSGRKQLPFQLYLDICSNFSGDNNLLIRRLLRNVRNGRFATSNDVSAESQLEGIKSTNKQDDHTPSTSQHFLGKIKCSSEALGLFDDDKLVPLFSLRGMDIMLTDGDPENALSTHPFLIEHGLRKVPGFNINIMTPWANIALYFEMPEWMRSGWDGISESESDSFETRALKVCINDS